MKIYVISLSGSPRRDKINQQLDSKKITYEFIDAIDKNTITNDDISKVYDSKACYNRHNRHLVTAEIACFMSHIKAWKIISENNDPAIILEDDAILTDNFNFLSDILSNKNIVNTDVILLGQSKKRPADEKKHFLHNPIYNKIKHGHISIGQAFKLWTSGMVGYYLTSDGAKKLINSNTTIKCVSDDWDFHAGNGVIIKEARPYVVWEDFENTPSNIESERSEATKHRNKIITTLLPPVRFIRAIYRNIAALILSRKKQA